MRLAALLAIGWTFAAFGCGPSLETPPASDAGCVANPVSGGTCEPGQQACNAGLECQPIWSCDTTGHWQEQIPNCTIKTPSNPSDAGDGG